MDNFLEVFDKLKENNIIADIWRFVLMMLKNEYHTPDDLLGLFCLFFALIDDGNTCIPLDAEQLKTKWHQKLDGLDNNVEYEYYDNVIDNGILAIKNYDFKNPLIFQYDIQNTGRKNNMFVIYNGWMFTEKFFNAKQSLEKSVDALFAKNTTSTDDDNEIQNIKSKYEYITPDGQKFELAHEQASAIARAKNGENLIITGGPGTGKTTVICYLLLELLSKHDDYSIYMAAPSGKAARRMKESIARSLTNVKPDIRQHNKKICDLIYSVKPSTIHKLLELATTNGIKQFPNNSVFIIDESSMIDLELFARLLNTIAQSGNARVFILGDKDQLPPVQPGAVFYDLTQNKADCLIELTRTHRFPENSDIYKLKEAIRTTDLSVVSKNWDLDITALGRDELKRGDVKYLDISEKDKIQKIVTSWYDKFCDNDTEYKRVYSDLDFQSPDIIKILDSIWAPTEKAKIFCAENHGIRGTEYINKIICEYIKSKQHIKTDNNDEFFIGEQIIVTKNQYVYELSNGDTGIIVSVNNKKYLMIKREDVFSAASDNAQNNEIIKHIGQYVFYPLYLLPSDSVESAYAITIHKSQGSEYDNILIFLPESSNSPLLNRQILYTAITRTKNTTYIVSNECNMKKAIQNCISRYTQVFV